MTKVEKKAEYDRERRAAMTPEQKKRDNELHRLSREKRREHYKAYQREWRKNNRDKNNSYMKKQRAKNENIRIADIIKSNINSALKGFHESKRITSLLGCNIDEYKKYIESLFEPGMTWENYGLHTWHMHHIKPCSSFDMRDIEQQKACFHYTNVKPVWAKAHWLGEV